jgi:putative addiction module component (TIGR02574 family)
LRTTLFAIRPTPIRLPLTGAPLKLRAASEGPAYRFTVARTAAPTTASAKLRALLLPKGRTCLAEQLLASLDESDLEQQWTAGAKRRWDEVRSSRVKPIPAEEVYRRIDRILGK